jgi:negative regulator of flagellin synthesis FlgM
MDEVVSVIIQVTLNRVTATNMSRTESSKSDRQLCWLVVRICVAGPDYYRSRKVSRKKGDAVMRIEAYNQITQIYGVQKSMKIDKTKSTGGFSDQLSISRMGRDYQIAKNAVSEASDIREDKVAQLKDMVESGTYQVSADDFASKLLENYGSW